MTKAVWMVGSAIVALLATPNLAQAQNQAQDQAALEARIALLEAQLDALKVEVQASRAEITTRQQALAQDVVRIEQRAAAVPLAPVQAAPVQAAPIQTAAAPVNGFRVGDNVLRFGGFIKADYSLSSYSGGDPANGDALRDFYLPGAIPVGGADEGPAMDFNARQTRFWLTSEGTIGGRRVGSRVEMDFQVLPGAGDQRTTSPSNLSLRRAFVTIDNWLFGQEWSNFQNIGVLPETADYIGPSEGSVFARQVQVRYTRGPFSISVENPETTLTNFSTGARIIADDNTMPDITARYAITRPWGEASISGIVRQLAYETTGVGAIDETTTGWGVSAAAKIKIGETDDLRVMLSGGEGIGRYVGLNFTNDAVLTSTGRLEAIPLVAGFAAYRHLWSPQWRSNLIYSFQNVDNDLAIVTPSVNRSAYSVRGNLIYSPVTALDFGAELSFGERELESGLSGDMTRLTVFAKYGF